MWSKRHVFFPFLKNAVTLEYECMCTYNVTMWPIVVLICFTILLVLVLVFVLVLVLLPPPPPLLFLKRHTSLWTWIPTNFSSIPEDLWPLTPCF